MPETATCTPGQGETTAVAPTTVVIQPAEGTFPSDPGSVHLISNKAPQTPAEMGVQKWDSERIVALLPERNPGTGANDEIFTVRIKSPLINPTYEAEADPVWVTGPPGSGYPPTHLPA